jgi:hypothetical protein
MSNDDFWTNFTLGQHKDASSLDLHLQAREEEAAARGIRVLTDKGRSAAALPLPADPGIRVSFIVNIGSVMSYADPPGEGAEGTVVMVRTAEGDQTGMGPMVFVKWDDGKFLAMHHEHLRRAKGGKKFARNFVRKALSLGDLTGFLGTPEETGTELIHKATNDLWSFSQGEDGSYVISRLFDETGEPLKG